MGRRREVLEWAAGSELAITEHEVDATYGLAADLTEQWDEVAEFDHQLYTVLRSTMEGVAFDIIGNASMGAGLEVLHKKYDPATRGRKRIMLQALTSPERASNENLGAAIERWKALRGRYNKKKDQFGRRKDLPDSLAMNALEKLVLEEMEMHLLLNFSRFKNFEEMEAEVVTFMEAKTGSKMAVSSNFSKNTGGGDAVPMDVDSLVTAVSGNLASLVKGKGKGGKGGGKGGVRFEGTCVITVERKATGKRTAGRSLLLEVEKVASPLAPAKAPRRSLRATATIAGSQDTGRRIAGVLEEERHLMQAQRARRAAPRARTLGHPV